MCLYVYKVNFGADAFGEPRARDRNLWPMVGCGDGGEGEWLRAWVVVNMVADLIEI